MEYIDKILCVTYQELTEGDDPVIKFCTLNKNITRKNILTKKRGGGEGGRAQIIYSSLSEKYKRRFVERIGDPVELLKQDMVRDFFKMDEKAREYFAGYEYDMNGVRTRLDTGLIEEYTLNASVLNALIDELADKVAQAKKLNNSRSDLWDIIMQSSENLRRRYGHTLPGNLSRLKEKIARYRKESYASLISGKVGNKNTLKITNEGIRQLIALKRSRVPVYTDMQIFKEYNRIAEEKGWKPIKSPRSLKQWLDSPMIEPLWHDAVFGELSAHQRYSRKHKTELPYRRDSLWYGDGTKLNLYYRDEAGKVRTTSVYEVIDAYSEVMLGYFISDTEDYEAQYHAYRMAIQISGHKPYEIVHDNQGGHKRLESSSFFGKICHVHRTTAPYSGQSKTIESVFGRFQADILHKDWRFTGQNITAKKAGSRPNLEFVEANKDKLYTLAELKAKYSEARREWNESLHPATGISRLEMYNSSVNEETPAVTTQDMVDMFWVMTKRRSTFTSEGIEITVKGKKYRYEVYSSPGVPDHEWRRTHSYQRFFVMYDPYDFSSVRLYWKDKAGKLRFERVAEPYLVIHRAIQDQTEYEAAFIRREQEANMQERVERQVAAKEIEYSHGVAPEQHGLSTPKLKGVTAEVMRQIDRRTRRYKQDPEEYQVGRVTKKTSNLTFDQIGEIKLNPKRVAGKL